MLYKKMYKNYILIFFTSIFQPLLVTSIQAKVQNPKPFINL